MATVIQTAADWVWGADPTGLVSPDICLEGFPLAVPQACLSRLIAKLLGVAIIVGAALVKLPILLSVAKTKSVSGFSAGSLYGEVIMYSNGTFYGVLKHAPFTAYGEGLFIAAQSAILVLLFWCYEPPSVMHRTIAIVTYVAYVGISFFVIPEEYYHLFHSMNWPAMVYIRGSLILLNFQLKHTGNQSAITNSLTFVGSIIRIFTTLKEVGLDLPMLSGFIIGASFNAVLLMQNYIYQEKTRQVLESLKTKKKKE